MRVHILPLVVLLLGVSACGGGAPPAPTHAPPLPAAGAPAIVVPPSREDGRLPPFARPRRYALDLTIDPAKKTFTGRARIDVTLAVPSRVVVLHGRGLSLRSVVAETSRGAVAGKGEARLAFGATEAPEELVLTFDETLPAGDAILAVDYEAPIVEEHHGIFRIEQPEGASVFTIFEPSSARRMFPGFDDPAFKTPFRLTIRTPKGNLAFANTKEIGKTEDPKAGLVVYEFAETAPLPTYVVALAVGPFEVLEGGPGPVPVRLIATRGKAALGKMALESAAALLERYAQYFDEPYPYDKLDLVAIPNFPDSGMENAGLIALADEILLVDGESSGTGAKRRLFVSLGHEIAHQWFGDLVTMRWWDEIWLKESFTQWITSKIVDAWHPEMRLVTERIGSKSWAMQQDALPGARAVRGPARTPKEIQESYTGLIWTKGEPLIAMLESWLGADAFRDGVRRYMKKHRHGTVISADLYAALSEASPGNDVAKVVDSFVGQSGVPVVTAELDCSRVQKGAGKSGGAQHDAGPPVLRLRQEEYRYLDSKEPSQKRWRIPVCVRHDAGGAPVRQCTLLEDGETRLELLAPRGHETSCPGFVYPNADEAGYYRHRFAPSDLERLATKAGASQLSETERIGLVANAWAAVWSGQLSLARYFELLRGFKDETSRLVFEQVVDTLLDAAGVVVTDAERPAFARYVREVVGPTGKRLGWTPKKGEPEDAKLVRSAALFALAGIGQDAAVTDEATKRANAWLDHPESADRDVAEIAIALAAKRGDPKTFERMMVLFKNPPSPEVRQIARRGLTSHEKPELVERVLDLLLDGSVKPGEAHTLLFPFLRRHTTVEAALAWADRHFDAIAKGAPQVPFVVARAPAALCDANRIRAVALAWRPRLEKLDAGKELDEYAELGLRCAALADKDGKEARAWLTSRGKAK